MGRPSNLRINVTSDSRQARQDMGRVESTTTNTLGKLKSAGPALAAAAGAAIGAALIDAVGQAMEQGKIKAVLNAQLDASGADAKRYGAAAGKLYTSGVTEDFQGAADAIRATMQNLVPAAPGEDLKDLATRASDLATVMGEDVQSTTRAVAQLLKTGLAKNAEEAFDILTKGAQNGANSSQDLLDTFNEYGTQFRDMGISGKQALGLISQALAGGARDSDVAADALKELNIRVKDLSAATALKTLGLDAKAMASAFAEGGPAASKALDQILDRLRKYEGTAKGTQLATTLLGTQAEDLSKALFAMDPSLAASTTALDGMAGASDRVGKSLRDSAGAQITQFQRTAQQGLVDFIGGQVIPVLRDLYAWWNDNLTPAMKSLTKYTEEYAGPILDEVVKGTNDVVQAAKDHEDELRTLAKWVGTLGKAYGKYIAFLAGAAFDAVVLWIDVVSQLVSWIKTLVRWVNNMIDALGRIKIPSALKFLVDHAGSILSAVSPSAASFAAPDQAPGLRAVGAVPQAQMIGKIATSLQSPLVVNITIDGQQLQGRINRTVNTALNMEGARIMAGGFV